MPRTVPFHTLNPIFAWTGEKSRPCSANSRAHHARMNRPRLSSCGLGSITFAPRTSVSLKSMKSHPSFLELQEGQTVFERCRAFNDHTESTRLTDLEN